MYVCVCEFTHISVYVSVCMYECVHVYVCVCEFTYISVYVSVCVHV